MSLAGQWGSKRSHSYSTAIGPANPCPAKPLEAIGGNKWQPAENEINAGGEREQRMVAVLALAVALPAAVAAAVAAESRW